MVIGNGSHEYDHKIGDRGMVGKKMMISDKELRSLDSGWISQWMLMH